MAILVLVHGAWQRERSWPGYELEAPHDTVVTHSLEFMDVLLMSLSSEIRAH